MKTTINLPGFSSEAIIHTINSYNRVQNNAYSSLKSQKVLMQLRGIDRLNCYENCDGSSDPFCYDQCDLNNDGGGGDGGSGGGGGSQPSCQPSCGPCIRSKTSLTNGFKICINASCKTRVVACHTNGNVMNY